MGLLEKIFGNTPKPDDAAVRDFFRTFTAYTPVFHSFQGGIYESERVRSAIDAGARHASKLGIRIDGTAKPRFRNLMKHAPNEFMTWSKFLYRAWTIREVLNNLFIVPIYDEFGEISGIYPVLPSRCEFVEYDGDPWIRYHFRNGDTGADELKNCGIVPKFQFEDDFLGATNRALIPTMDLISIQDQGIKEGVKSAATYRFMARSKNFATDADLKKERLRFSRANFEEENGGGLLLFPNTYDDIKQIESRPFVIDADQMKAIDTNVFNYFGVNEAILQNRASDEELDSFYNGAIEPFEIMLSDVLTKMVFSNIEQTNGNRVVITANRLQYMSVSHKIQLAQQLGDRGMITIDEIRELFNYPALPNNAGKRSPIRGEFYFVEDGRPADNPPAAE